MTAAVLPGSVRRERPSTGTAGMLRVVLRRDRVLLPLWILLTVGVLAASAVSTAGAHPTAAARADRVAQVHEVPMFPLFQSMIFGQSPAAVAAQQAFGVTTILAGLGAVLLVVRHTRAEEQRGRQELLGAAAIGRSAPLAAALLAVTTGGLVIAVLGVAAMQIGGHPVGGSVLLGLMAGGAACLGAGVAGVLAQLCERGRTAAVVGLAVVMGMHFLRGLGHLTPPPGRWLTMASPSGWLEGVRPYAGDRWWLLLPVAALAAALAALALALSSRRDLGAGLLPSRRGREHAPPHLRGVLTLALRRHVPSFLVWGCVTAAVGLAFGGVGADATAGYADSAWVREFAAALGVAEPARAFFVYVVFVVVFPLSVPAILTVLQLRGDETDGTADLLLSAPVPRRRWAAATTGVALAGSASLLAVLGLALTLAAPELDGLLDLTLSLVPAIWVFIGIVVLAIGLVPRAAVAIAWTALVIGIAGEIVVKAGLPEIIYLVLSPIAHVNPYYATPHAGAWLLAIAAVTTGGGIVAIGRRDLTR